MTEEIKETGEAEEIITDEAFSVSAPIPDNKRLISVAGLIPNCESSMYWLFEKFLWTLVGLDKEKTAPITLLINSCGGDADSFFHFHDFITMLKSPIYTATNKAESAGAMMFLLGAKGHRYIFPSGHIMLHNCQMACPSCEKEGKQWGETEKEDKLLTLYNQRLSSLIDKCTGGRILKLLPGNFTKIGSQQGRNKKILTLLRDGIILTAGEAIKYGLADYIVTPQIFDEIQRI